MSTQEIVKIGVEEFEFFIFDWQKKELDFSLSLATKKIIKKGSKWQLA